MAFNLTCDDGVVLMPATACHAGAGMFLSWGVTLPLGIFIARFAKKVQAGVRSGTTCTEH
jgi:hypothetical protein